MNLEETLSKFAKDAKFKTTGPLSVALVVTQKAREGLPLNPKNLLSKKSKTQVSGLGKNAVQAILKRHGIERVLSEEAGRTSRGSSGNMQAYVKLLNSLPRPVDLDAVEKFWVSRVQDFFAGKPFKFRTDASLSIRASVRDLLNQAAARQKELPGSRFEGTMLQHLVGAKLDIVLGPGVITHHGASDADAAGGRDGDFLAGDAAIHVTTHPGESVVRKCAANLDAGLRPVIVTVGKGSTVAEGLAEHQGIASRVDILDAEQFLAANLHEWGKFDAKRRSTATAELIARYNQLIENHERDPALKVDLL